MHAPSRGEGQYRSAIFTHTPEQKAAAQAAIERLRKAGARVETRLEPASTFWRAEEYHQRYYEKNGMAQSAR